MGSTSLKEKVNGFPDDFESMDAEYYATFPFSIQQKLIANGGQFEYSKSGWDDFSIADGRLIMTRSNSS